MEAQAAVVAITPAAMRALDAIRPVGAIGDEKVVLTTISPACPCRLIQECYQDFSTCGPPDQR